MFAPGGTELIVILAIILLLFGSSKLPELARSLGSAKKEFHDGMKEEPETPEKEKEPPKEEEKKEPPKEEEKKEA